MSVAIRVDIDTDALVFGLGRLSERFPHAVQSFLEAVGLIGVQLARLHTPRGRTGWSRASIEYRVEGTSVTILSRSWRFHYIEYGTRPSLGRFVPDLDVRLTNPLHPSFGVHPGVPAQRPFAMARVDLEALMPTIVNKIIEELRT